MNSRVLEAKGEFSVQRESNPVICICPPGGSIAPDVPVTVGHFLSQYRHEIKYLHRRPGEDRVIETGGFAITVDNLPELRGRLGSLEFLNRAGLLSAFERSPFKDPLELPEASFPEIMEELNQRGRVLTQIGSYVKGRIHNVGVLPLLYDEEGHIASTAEEIRALGVKAATEKDTEAFGGWLEGMRERLGRYVAKRIGSIDEAEDLASEVIFKALKGFGDFKVRGETADPCIFLESWFFKIAKNRTIDFLKSSRHSFELGYLADINYPFQKVGLSIEHAAVDNLNRSFQAQLISESLAQLSDQQREVVVLKFWEGMNGNQIGSLLGKKAGAIRQSLSSALDNLRISLYGVEGVDPRIDDRGEIGEADYVDLSILTGVRYERLEDLVRAAEKRGDLRLHKSKGSERRVFIQEEVKSILTYLEQVL